MASDSIDVDIVYFSQQVQCAFLCDVSQNSNSQARAWERMPLDKVLYTTLALMNECF